MLACVGTSLFGLLFTARSIGSVALPSHAVSRPLLLVAQPSPALPRAPPPRLGAGKEIFDDPGWTVLATELDQLPAFSVANPEGQPLQYELEGAAIAMFFADLDAAKGELAEARKQYPDMSLDIIPVGIGSAYKLACEGKAKLYASPAEQSSARGPNGELFPMDALPLFGCLELSQSGSTGEPVLPLFMASADAQDAVAQACAAEEESSGEKVELEIMVLSLERAIELLVTVKDTPAFRFVPPAKSLEFIQAYLAEA